MTHLTNLFSNSIQLTQFIEQKPNQKYWEMLLLYLLVDRFWMMQLPNCVQIFCECFELQRQRKQIIYLLQCVWAASHTLTHTEITLVIIISVLFSSAFDDARWLNYRCLSLFIQRQTHLSIPTTAFHKHNGIRFFLFLSLYFSSQRFFFLFLK